jgi:hypothetical protein
MTKVRKRYPTFVKDGLSLQPLTIYSTSKAPVDPISKIVS